VLIYPAADVLHIAKSPSPQRQSAPIDDDPDAPPPPATPSPSKVLKPEPKKQDGPIAPDASAASGVLFYDPRRPKKYWSSPSRHHDSFNEAMAALAEEFGRTPQWIERQLSDTNDLSELRAHLQSRLSRDVSTPAAPDTSAEEIKFYDPRRPKKYQTGPDSSHRSYEEALEALAREFQSPVEWIELNMGESNDMEAIRSNLLKAKNDQ
jgi:hypothetical protein